VFQSVDAPESVSSEGMNRFLHGVTEEMVQERRERLLDVTARKVKDVAQEFIVDALAAGKGKMAFLGEKRDWVDGTWELREMGIEGPKEGEEILDEGGVKEAALGS
jgi:Zn-dependent M16 (insulinase) family peptidase